MCNTASAARKSLRADPLELGLSIGMVACLASRPCGFDSRQVHQIWGRWHVGKPTSPRKRLCAGWSPVASTKMFGCGREVMRLTVNQRPAKAAEVRSLPSEPIYLFTIHICVMDFYSIWAVQYVSVTFDGVSHNNHHC